MTRKMKTLIAAAALLVLLGGGYYGSTIYKKKTAEVSAGDFTPSPKLGKLSTSDLARIEMPDLTLEKQGENWELVSLNGAPPPAGIELDQDSITRYTYPLANVFVDDIVEEAPADISIYGLANPSARIAVADSSGKEDVYLFGDMNPSRNAYYVMQEGDPRVYLLSSYTADYLMFDLGSIRPKALFPVFEITDLSRMNIESSEANINIIAKPDFVPAYMGMVFSTHIMTSPYKLPRGVDSEAFQKCIEPLNGLSIDTFADDTPASLAPYGLDKPLRLYLETARGTVDLLIGNPVNDTHYAKRADAPGVFTLRGLAPLVEVTPFSLTDKFAFIVNIDNVDQITVTGGEIPLTVDFQGKGEEAVYSVNGKKAETKSFKAWYQATIGLLTDAEYPGPARNPALDSSEEITIAYKLNTPAGAQTAITLIPYDRDYYSLLQENTMEFLISRNQVRKMFAAADAIVFEE